MKPEEKFNKRLLKVLQEIKFSKLLTESGQPLIKFRKDASDKYENDVLDKLVELEAIYLVKDPLKEFLDAQTASLTDPTLAYSPKNLDLTKLGLNSGEVFIKLGPKFGEIYKRFLPVEKNELRRGAISFISKGVPTLTFDAFQCPLPVDSNDFYLCEILFKYKRGAGARISYDEFSAIRSKSETEEGKRRAIYDACRSLNTRIQKAFRTDDIFLTWENKTIIRNF